MVEDEVIEAGALTNVSVLDLGEVGNFMSKVFSSHHERREESQSHIMGSAQSEPNCIGSSDEVDLLLSKASRAIEILATRCEIMEHDLTEVNHRVVESEQIANRWKNLVLELRSKTETDQVLIEQLRTRSQEAEARIAFLELSATDARERVAAADAKSSRLHHQVIAAFGRKSPVHSVLQAVTFQEAAE